MKSKLSNQHGHQNECIQPHTRHRIFNLIDYGPLIGLVSLFWLMVKTGQKPSRITYPCQQNALANIGIFLVPPLAFAAHRGIRWVRRTATAKQMQWVILFGLMVTGIFGIGWFYDFYSTRQYYERLRLNAPFGKPVLTTAGAATAAFMTLPHAMALPSPHRVVSVHDADATGWTFPCTATGPCAAYYGDDAYVDQDVVDQMVASGLKALTGKAGLLDAWQTILPNYLSGEVVAIKVNFNDSIAGGGTYGHGDNDAYVDALPQVINSIIDGLTAMGVSEEDIWIFDVSRYITDRFRQRIRFSSVRYVDRTGNGGDIDAATFNSTDPSASVVFTDTPYRGTHKIADVLVDADYLINVPIMKRHGSAGITLASKNHLGSINGFYTGDHAMHNYMYLVHGDYLSTSNPLVDINRNPNIAGKTVLIVGDALYGGWSSNNTPPERWTSFGNDSPNMLFFGADPVAVDSVMFDYLNREGYVNPKSEDVLVLAANAGLGIHERWNNNTDRSYQTIDYVEIEGAGTDPDPDPDPDPAPVTPQSSGGGGGCFVETLFGSP